jgi:hypothetical protein
VRDADLTLKAEVAGNVPKKNWLHVVQGLEKRVARETASSCLMKNDMYRYDANVIDYRLPKEKNIDFDPSLPQYLARILSAENREFSSPALQNSTS